MRIAAVSDLHGQLPVVPPCDLLIVAGDVCPDAFERKFSWDEPELQKAWFDQNVRPWLAASPATHKVLTWGNHDACGAHCDFSADAPDVADSRTLQIVNTRTTTIHHEGRNITIWASPWCNPCGMWVFWKKRPELAKIYDTIPEGIDILVSHQPPFGCCDGVPEWDSDRVIPRGSRELLQAIDRVKPKLMICGHLHEGRGNAERNGTRIFNVSLVDERYRPVHPVTTIDL